MKTTARALALVLLAPLSLSAAPLKGNFLLIADSTVAVTNMMTFSKGNASLVSNTGDNLRITADEITVDQTNLTRTRITVITCRGVTSVSSGLTIPPRKNSPSNSTAKPTSTASTPPASSCRPLRALRPPTLSLGFPLVSRSSTSPSARRQPRGECIRRHLRP